jgi:hypothetical protein
MKARRGQILVFFALLLPFLVLILLGALEAAADVLRVQETMAAADLAAHAGVQAAVVTVDGRPAPAGDAGAHRALQVFLMQRPPHARLVEARCGHSGVRVACRVAAETETVGWFPFVGRRPIRVSAIAYLVSGATRGEQ